MDIVNNTCVYLYSQKNSKTQKYYFAGENISNGKVHRKFTLFFWFALKKVKIFTERIFYDKGHLPDRFLCFFIFLKSFLRSLLSCLSPRAWPVGRGFWGASELTDDFLDEDLVDFTTGTDVAFNWLNLTIWSELKYVISPLSFNFIDEYYYRLTYDT